MAAQIHFLFSMSLDGYVFNPFRPQGLDFNDAKTGLEISIRGPDKAGTPWDGFEDLRVYAKISCDATNRQTRFVEKLINNRTIDPKETPISLPYFGREKELIAANGEISKGYSPTSSFLPKDLQELCVAKGNELEQHSIRFVRLLRWMGNTNGPAIFQKREDSRFGLSWRTTQDAYHRVPWPKQDAIELDIEAGLQWRDADSEVFSALWHSNREEPLAHELLREAKGLFGVNDRSALLICYSALEVGIKQHIGACAPIAQWLVKHSPSPPIQKILKEYLPEIHKHNPNFMKWSSIESRLNKKISAFTEDRNRLAHRGEELKGSLKDYIQLTEDLLYALDVFEGNDWAKNQVNLEFAKDLGWKQENQFCGTLILYRDQ